MTIGFQHPLAIGLVGIFAVGSTASAVAGEREGGTLEVLLARPLSRRRFYDPGGASVKIVAAVVLALLAGQVIGIASWA